MPVPRNRALLVLACLTVAAMSPLGCTRSDSGAAETTPQSPQSNAGSTKNSDPATAAILAADRRYWGAQKKGDWPLIAALLAPEYYGVSADLELNRDDLARDLAKTKLLDYELQRARVRLVRPDLAVVSYTGRMKEIFDGQDISGRYWYSTTWVLQNHEWKL